MSDAIRTAKGFVTVEELPPQGMIVVRGDLGLAPLKKAVTQGSGHPVPGKLEINGGFGGGVAWMSPDELLVFCDRAEASTTAETMTGTLGQTFALAVDVSDARTAFRLTGDGIREALAKLSPADMSPGALPPGRIRRTRLAQVPAALWFATPEEACVIAFRSVADYVFDLLANASAKSAEVGYF